MPCMPTRYKGELLQMHTVVDQPLTHAALGRISCRPLGHEPIRFEWTGPNGAAVEVDVTGSEAIGVAPGRYRVVAIDANNARADVILDVEPVLPDAVVISAYRVVPASTSTSRDGGVEIAAGAGLDTGWRFLWTNGVETDGPRLRDVPSGAYAAVAIPHDDSRVPTTIHQCPPARVTVARDT